MAKVRKMHRIAENGNRGADNIITEVKTTNAVVITSTCGCAATAASDVDGGTVSVKASTYARSIICITRI